MAGKFSRKQTGSPGRTDYGRKGRKATKIKNPWGGPNIPLRISAAWGKVSGSSRREPKSAPELRGMRYPANTPYAWPVEIDKVGHVRQPSESGLNATTAATHNAAVEQAYTRAKYQ